MSHLYLNWFLKLTIDKKNYYNFLQNVRYDYEKIYIIVQWKYKK